MNTPRDAVPSALGHDHGHGVGDVGWPVTARRDRPANNGDAREIHLGEAHPLGAHWDGRGTNFSLYSEVADGVELCLFDSAGREERIQLPERHAHIHHVYLPGVGPGQRYGYRVHGPWDPGLGLRCNAAKLLIDPYARAVEGSVDWNGPVFGHRIEDPGRPDLRDSAPFVPRSIVVDPAFDWRGDEPLRTPWHHTIIYETHVRGLSMTHPEVPPALRGTYAGMASEPILRHLVDLGITAVELMPVHHFVPEGFTVERGLTNYWGYSTAAFFAPHGPYSSAGDGGAQVREFKELVRALHAVGIEVILDVVYNHTTEGTADGRVMPASTTPPTTASTSPTPAATRTSPAPGTRSTCATRPRWRWSWTACGTGCSTCTSTGSVSISPRRWPASCTRSIACRRSSI
ncbi:MAG: alpha-amylase family glycosyl hydrolase [Acidimicrobiales bacterium]